MNTTTTTTAGAASDGLPFAAEAGAFALVATCAGHSATVRALDWSEDGALLRSQCVGGELLHWRAPEGAKTRTADASNTAPSRALRATAARWARRAASRSAWA